MNEQEEEFDILIEDNNKSEFVEEIDDDDNDFFDEDGNDNLNIIIKILVGIILIGITYFIYTTYKDYSLKKHSLADFKIENNKNNYLEANSILDYLINEKNNTEAMCYKAEYILKEKAGLSLNYSSFLENLNKGMKSNCQSGYIEIYDYLISNKNILIQGVETYPEGFQQLSEEYSEHGMVEMTSILLDYYLDSNYLDKDKKIKQILSVNTNVDKSYYLGMLYIDPNSSNYNLPQAYNLFKSSYEKGNKKSAFELAKLHFIGYESNSNNPNIPSIEKDYNKAVGLINEAVLSGHYDLAFKAAEIFYNGKFDTAKNYIEASNYYEIVANNKELFSQEELKTSYERLIKMYYNGVGVKEDKEKAEFYYQLFNEM